ncbi:MAG: peptide deformylase [Nitrospiraceae bacterium]
MALLPITKLGNPLLRKRSEPVPVAEIRTPAFQQLIDDMFETMDDANGIGLAAPQVGRSIQLLVMACEGEGGFPTTVLINPKIVFYGSEMSDFWEGCLSVDNLRGKVTRPSSVRVQGLDRLGAPVDIEAQGLYATCIQHEMDHLIGKVFIDRMTDLTTLAHLDEFAKYWQKDGEEVV